MAELKEGKISLLDKVLKASELSLEFSGLSIQRAQDKSMIAVLQLSAPLEFVRGSQEVEFNGARIPVTATDVTEVKVHQDDFDDIVWDEKTDTGSYKGSSLMLDVTKTRQVWLRSESFAAGGQKQRTKLRNERLETLVKGLSGGSLPANAGGAPAANKAQGPAVVDEK